MGEENCYGKECAITHRSYTYGQLHKLSRTLAANLRKKFGISDRDTVGLISPNSPEYPIVTIGTLAAGATLTTFSPFYTAYEIQTQIQQSGLKLIFAHPDTITAVQEALLLSKKQIPVVSLDSGATRADGTVSFNELVEDNHVDLDILKKVNLKTSDVAFLPYSSGTTGLPKGVELTHRNIVANCAQQDTELKHYIRDAPYQENQLVVLPMYHCYSLVIAMVHKLSVGIKLHVLPKFQPDPFLQAMRSNRINILYVAPPMVLFLGSHPQVTSEIFDHITCMMCGAAPLARADIDKMFAKAKREVEFAQGYGLTEVSPLATANPLGARDYMTAGSALPNVELRVVDGEMRNLGPNEVGELLIKGPNVMKGYKDNPEANNQVFMEDGWLRTGDLASLDENGRVVIADRLKELIKVKGYQVPPAELENVIKQHPAVFDAAVIGVPDSYSGERPKAFVMLKEKTNVSEKEITDFVNKRVAHYKNVKDLTFIDNIPKSPSGKVLRRVLKDI
ncbi:4-coumarate--CoA ligase 1-like isoform X2 [Leguminivora glycinivorella]|uniref:4-coumarate--CoA ligase 1-like isoform X2 n=1 Tax=Leguminivora glycinivorella TaxID=1035111 RepID=UPI00200DA95A|nr:4-coumarate--CoA ligase 1-like isoform X2 [Leguminivora glycinivorella]